MIIFPLKVVWPKTSFIERLRLPCSLVAWFHLSCLVDLPGSWLYFISCDHNYTWNFYLDAYLKLDCQSPRAVATEDQEICCNLSSITEPPSVTPTPTPPIKPEVAAPAAAGEWSLIVGFKYHKESLYIDNTDIGENCIRNDTYLRDKGDDDDALKWSCTSSRNQTFNHQFGAKCLSWSSHTCAGSRTPNRSLPSR